MAITDATIKTATMTSAKSVVYLALQLRLRKFLVMLSK